MCDYVQSIVFIQTPHVRMDHGSCWLFPPGTPKFLSPSGNLSQNHVP